MKITNIELAPLSISDISDMLQDIFQEPQAEIQDLSACVHARTGVRKSFNNYSHHSKGIPYGIVLFLKMLYEEELIWFNGINWDWDTSKIVSCQLRGSIVDLVIGRILLLPEETQKVDIINILKAEQIF